MQNVSLNGYLQSICQNRLNGHCQSIDIINAEEKTLLQYCVAQNAGRYMYLDTF